MPTTCSVPECDRSTYARQPLCEAHYRRRLRTGHVAADRPVGSFVPKECMVETCHNVCTERGLCHGHYLRLIRHGDVLADRPLDRRVNTTCTVDGCDRDATAGGMCPTHRIRLRRHGDAKAAVPIQTPVGGGFVHKGYRRVPVPPELRWLVGGAPNDLEHRFVMAQLLGRPLRPDESVHHRSGDRLDNRPENLELWSRYQPRGQRVGDKVEYAIEILTRYAPNLLR